jgi:hypothetical protein
MKKALPDGIQLGEVHFTTEETEDHVWFEDRWMVTSLCDE